MSPTKTIHNKDDAVKQSQSKEAAMKNNQLPYLMIHHKDPISKKTKIIIIKGTNPTPYGVSPASRVMTPGVFLRQYDRIRDCLISPLHLSTAEREVVLRLLRLYAYYGIVYPKESQITEEPGCSKATFWRTIRFLKELGLVEVINRYILRPKAQISNLYRLDRLVLMLARYLSEHGVHFYASWLKPYLMLSGTEFWRGIVKIPVGSVGPG
jgi:hypothetical protein